MTDYQDRHLIEFIHWPEFFEAFASLSGAVFGPGEIDQRLKGEVFTVSSLAAGCRHCQAHGAYGLHLDGVDTDRIQALWEFESSDLFSDAERAALRFAMAAGAVPNAVTAEHHAALREHFTNRQIAEIVGVLAMGGLLNRYNDTIATVTDQESVDWANDNLVPVGWDIGKHVGAAEEQRPMHPKHLGL